MMINTSRFGELEVDPTRFIHFDNGLLGFPDNRDFALIQTNRESGFYWLQAVDRAELAFVVCDPRLFLADFSVAIKAEDLAQLGLSDAGQTQVFVIVNKIDDLLTANLQGPLVISVETRMARQQVLSDKRYSTRHPLMRIPSKQTAVSRSA